MFTQLIEGGKSIFAVAAKCYAPSSPQSLSVSNQYDPLQHVEAAPRCRHGDCVSAPGDHYILPYPTLSKHCPHSARFSTIQVVISYQYKNIQ